VNLWGRVGALERTLTHVTSVTGAGGLPEVRIAGANLRLVNGLRATATTNGLGNLLVGYNEPRQGGNVETGSHNVVVGQGHNFSSFGGLVVGRRSAAGSLTEPVARAPRSAAGSTIRPAPAPPRSAAGEGTRPAARAPRSTAGMGTRPAAIPRRLVGDKRTRPAASSPQ
jgi:hypothetical protein